MKTFNKYFSFNFRFLKALPYVILVVLFIFSACTTKKNTKTTRAYHNLTSQYNVYFNGNESLKAGLQKIKKNYEEDYTKILPVFRYEDKAVATLVASEMDRTIKKSAKTIKIHSITVKPELDKKNMSREDMAFLSQAEYCKWIDDAYLIMGKAHFYKREFETARQMFLLVINKYKNEDTKYDAMLWLAKTYAELEEYKNAENTLIDLRKKKKYDDDYMLQIELIYASMSLNQKDYNIAAQRLNSAIELEKNKKEKTRHIFILAQIYQFNKKYSLAEEHFKTVIKRNPNYEMAFMAQIYLAEIFEKTGGNAQDLKKRLKKMVKDDKNVDYLDQLYYALGKIELNQKNTDKAIEYFTLSTQAPSSNKAQKVKTYLALAEYYYDKKNYQFAGAYYDSTANSMETTFPDYERIQPQVQTRNNLCQNLNIVITEDSLQFVAKMPEKDRDRIINKIIQKILDEERKQQEANAAVNTGMDPMFDDINPNRQNTPTTDKSYFGNPTTVSYGMTEFKKRWGDRKLADNWRRSNKQVVVGDNQEVADNSNNPDSVKTENNEEVKVTDPKKREFYLQNLPLTDEKMVESNLRIENALLNSGNIYYKEMNETGNAITQYEKLLNRFPDTKHRLEALYNMYSIYNKDMNYSKAETYKSMIINEFPESVYAKILKDPAYVQRLIKSQEEAEKTYQQAYNKYKSKEYYQAIGLSNNALTEFPENELAPNFVYLTAVSYGELGNKEELKKNLQLILLKYPDAEVSENAKATLEVMSTKKYEENIYSLNKDTVHYYVLVFPHEKTDLNKLKFKYISLNAEHYTQEDLKTNVVSLDAKRDMIIVRDFKNVQKALEYYQLTILKGALEDIKHLIPNHFVISADNYQTFLKNKDEAKYMKFYNQNYLIN